METIKTQQSKIISTALRGNIGDVRRVSYTSLPPPPRTFFTLTYPQPKSCQVAFGGVLENHRRTFGGTPAPPPPHRLLSSFARSINCRTKISEIQSVRALRARVCVRAKGDRLMGAKGRGEGGSACPPMHPSSNKCGTGRETQSSSVPSRSRRVYGATIFYTDKL